MPTVKTPALPFYGKEFYDDERVWLMPMSAQGLYVALLWNQWQEGSVPADLNMIASLVGKQAREIKKDWTEWVSRFFAEIEPERLANPKLEKIRAEVAAVRTNRQQAGSKGGSKKQANDQANAYPSNADASADESTSPFDSEKAFDLIWRDILENGIPEPRGRKAARLHYLGSVHSQDDAYRCLLALGNYRKCDRVQRGFIQNASTWFNNWPDWLNVARPVVATPGPRITIASQVGRNPGDERADTIRALLYELEADLSVPFAWSREDCTREQAEAWCAMIRGEYAERLGEAPTLTEWLSAVAV